MRIARAVAGVLLLLVALPMLIAGGTLWEAARHRDADGAFRAQVAALRTDEAAIVVWDFDALLRREAPFARGGRTSLRIDVPGHFVGLAPRGEVEHYLGGAGWLEIDRVRLARGPLPVDATTVPAGGSGPVSGGTAGGDPGRLATPVDQVFWHRYATGDQRRPLSFAPSSVRGDGLALVIMNDDAAAGVDADVSVAVAPAWLDRTTSGVLILGTMLLLLGSVAVAWPRPRRDIVYVVEPAQIPQVTAHLGLPVIRPEYIADVEPPPAPLVPPKPPVTVRLEWPPAQTARSTAAPVPTRD